MGLIREPLDVDFYVIDKPLTEAEKKAIALFIQKDKEKMKSKETKKYKTIPDNTCLQLAEPEPKYKKKGKGKISGKLKVKSSR